MVVDVRPIIIRPIRPDDGERLQRSHARLSATARRARYLAPKPHLSAADARYLAEVDGRDHVALVAARGDEIVGVARFVRLPDDPRTAEFAIVVADDWQRRGLGSELLRRLAEEAVSRGVDHFAATALAENTGIHRLVDAFAAAAATGRGARWRQDGSLAEVRFDLRPAAVPAMIAGCASR